MPARDIAIRAERADDHDGIGDVHRLAFAGKAEARLVDDLRRSGDAVISLVAEHQGRVIGHVLFSRLKAPMRALALAPLVVVPENQQQGIGSSLVRAGLERADATGWDAVFVLGAPSFYERFGFSGDAAKDYACAYNGEHFMVRALGRGEAPGSGVLNYPTAFAALERQAHSKGQKALPTDIAAKIASALVGRHVMEVEGSGYDWLFRLGDNRLLCVRCPWRIVAEGRIAHGDEDDAQQFGLPEPVNGAQRSTGLLAGKLIEGVAIREETGDFTITFENRTSLEILNTSSGYEAWRFDDGMGWNVVAMGGGELSFWNE
jgi:putative acetyltransferase